MGEHVGPVDLEALGELDVDLGDQLFQMGLALDERQLPQIVAVEVKQAVKTTVANDAVLTSRDSVERWSKWALAEADRIDPVKTARFLDEVEEQDDTK
jgi:type IV secretory pathway VirD2 relaxase